jgi:hypothetical protein
MWQCADVPPRRVVSKNADFTGQIGKKLVTILPPDENDTAL